jgi:hypothetical protein
LILYQAGKEFYSRAGRNSILQSRCKLLSSRRISISQHHRSSRGLPLSAPEIQYLKCYSTGVGIRTLDNWTAELGFGQNRLGSAFGRTNPLKTVGQARTVGQFRTARLSFGQLGSARTFGQLGQLGQSRAELPNDETHPVQPMKMIFSFLFLAKSRFEGVTVSRIALL